MNLASISYSLQSGIGLFGSILHGGALPQLGYWDYVFLMLLSAVQGPVAALFGATAAAGGIVRPEGVFLAICTGNLTVDMLWYSLGRAGKIDWLLGSNRWLKVPRGRVEQLRGMITGRSSMVMTLAKFTTGFVIPTMIATGLARVPWKRWLPTLFAAELVRTGALVAIGFYSASFLREVLAGYTYLSLAFSLVLLLASGWIIHRTLHLKDRLENNQA